jgi:hypothetical protein
MKQMNRLKAVLAEQHRTGKWLAEAVGRNEATVLRWCTIILANHVYQTQHGAENQSV